MTRNPSNTYSFEQSSEKSDIDLFIANRHQYNDIVEIYQLIGYKYRKLAQSTQDGRAFFFDVLSKYPIPSEQEINNFEERDIFLLQQWGRMKQWDFLIVQKIKVDWNTLFKAISILKTANLEKNPAFKILMNDLTKLDIKHTIKQIIPLIALYKDIKTKKPDVPKVRYKFTVMAYRNQVRLEIDHKSKYIIKPEIRPISKNTVPGRSKEAIPLFDIMTLRNYVRENLE